ncbi:DUF192 domain-containing protein [archaeon]|nr:DUF192 domain-containing protein [archaeon]
MKKIFLFLLLILSCSQVVPYAKIGNLIIPLEIAEDNSKGLMFRESLEGGMLFVFNEEKPAYFWMKNTKLPLDIFFLDKNSKIVDFKENFQPCINDSCEIYTSLPAKYAIEVNAGFIKGKNLKIGDFVEIKTQKSS